MNKDLLFTKSDLSSFFSSNVKGKILIKLNLVAAMRWMSVLRIDELIDDNHGLWEIAVDIFSMQGSFQNHFIIFNSQANSI